MSPERREIVVLCGAIAALSGIFPTVEHSHPRFAEAWLGCMVVALAWVIYRLMKLRQEER